MQVRQLKILFFIFTPILLLAQQPKWHVLHPTNGYMEIDLIDLIDEENGFAVSNCSYVVQTDNGGRTWIPVSSFDTRIRGLDFTDENNGWVIADDLYKTTDGGLTWEKQMESFQFWESFQCLSFHDAYHGWIGNYEGYVLRTQDAGASWDTLPIPATGNIKIDNIHFFDSQRGWMAASAYGATNPSDYYLYKTENGGLSWEHIPDEYWPVHIKSFDELFSRGGTAKLRYTADAGETWSIIDLPLGGTAPIGWGVTSMFFLNDTLGWAAGIRGHTVVTHDGGQTWDFQIELEYIYDFGQSYVTDITFKESGEGRLYGTAGYVIETYNFGEDWTMTNMSMGGILTDLFFLDEHIGYAISSDGGIPQIIKTIDAGMTWFSFFEGYPRPINEPGYMKIHFTDEDKGLVCGDSIYYTQDGGQTWLGATTPTYSQYSSINHIYFNNEQEGFVCGENRLFMGTQDGGQTWEKLSTFDWITDSVNTAKVQFFSDQEGWIKLEVGDWPLGTFNTVLLRTTDGGHVEWEDITPDATGGFRDFHIINDSLGYALGNNSFWKTIDKGSTWEQVSYIASGGFQKMDFEDAQNGFVETYGNVIHVTKDGGQTWEGLERPFCSVEDPINVFGYPFTQMLPDYTLITGGRYSNILKYGIPPEPTFVKEEIAELDIIIYPNPANDYFEVKNLTQNKPEKLTLYNALGELVLIRKMNSFNAIKVDVSGISSGLYFYNIKFEKGKTLGGKVVVE